MFAWLKKYLAIRSYMRRLSHELVRRFGSKSHYKIEHVTQAVKRSGLSAEHIQYAHAAFCDQKDFEAAYRSHPVQYRDLRLTIARRYFSGNPTFDAKTIVHKFRHAGKNAGDHYESEISFEQDGSGH